MLGNGYKSVCWAKAIAYEAIIDFACHQGTDSWQSTYWNDFRSFCSYYRCHRPIISVPLSVVIIRCQSRQLFRYRTLCYFRSWGDSNKMILKKSSRSSDDNILWAGYIFAVCCYFKFSFRNVSILSKGITLFLPPS